MTRGRMLVGGVGVALMAYGAWRILGTAHLTRPRTLALWLVGAVVVHDGVLAPLTMTTGYVLGRVFRPRARRYVVGALVTGAIVTTIAVPEIRRQRKAPEGSTLEARDYVGDLILLLGVVAAVAVVAYVVRVVRDHRSARVSATKVRPPDDHTSSTR